MSEKRFVMKHVIKNVEKMRKDDTFNECQEGHFNLIWSIKTSRDEHNYTFDIDCTTKNQESEKWSVDVEFEFRLIGKEVLTLNGNRIFQAENSGKNDAIMRIEASRINRYLINGNLTVECHVKILKADGVKGMKSKFDEESMKKHSDVVLVVDGEKFHVSKSYLASRSTYFESLLMGDFKESNQSEVVLQGIEVDDFQNFLEVLYAETVITDNTVDSVLHLAEMYDTKCLIKRAEAYLLEKSKKSLKSKLHLAVRYNLEGVKKTILSKNLSKVMMRYILPDDVSQLDHAFMAELFKKYLSASD